MEFFERPATFDEGDGEVVEECGLGRELSLHPEVVEGGNDAFAEEGGPMTIDDDAGGEWVFGRDEPAGEFESVFGEGFVFGINGNGEAGRDLLFGLGVFTTMAKEGRAGVSGGTFLHDESGRSLELFLKCADLVGLSFEFGGLEKEVL